MQFKASSLVLLKKQKKQPTAVSICLCSINKTEVNILGHSLDLSISSQTHAKWNEVVKSNVSYNWTLGKVVQDLTAFVKTASHKKKLVQMNDISKEMH